MPYSAELFGREVGALPPVSEFNVRITPPIQIYDGLIDNYFGAGDEVTGYVSTNNCTVLEIASYGSTIHTDDDPNFDESMPKEAYPVFRSHEDRMKHVAMAINLIVAELNAIDDPDDTSWALYPPIDLEDYRRAGQ
jgi:hypothetical protein